MGYAHSVYGVDLAKLRKLWGSADDKTKKALLKKQAERIEENDENFSDEIEEEGAPSLTTCIDDIFAGKISSKEFGFQYGYALEVICAHLGSRVDDLDMTWFDEFLDPLLSKVKQPSVEKLLHRNERPIAIPEPDDFPEIGFLDDAAMTKLEAALDAIAAAAEAPAPAPAPAKTKTKTKTKAAKGKAKAAPKAKAALTLDDDAAEVISELRGWLARAKKGKKQIVWFVY